VCPRSGVKARRNVVERCFNRLKGFRGIATRYEKTATSYEAAVNLASVNLFHPVLKGEMGWSAGVVTRQGPSSLAW
jgi:hypothetical protein